MKTRDVTHRAPRMDRRLREHVHDPYKMRRKIPEPSVCPDCGAVFDRGRWQWVDVPPPSVEEPLCQACHRIRDHYPAGTVTLEGGFLEHHRDEILHLVRHEETQEKGEHPLNRIMKIEEEPGRIVVSTTDIHLPRRIGEALHHAYQGELDFLYEEEAYFLRVHWGRD